jgi:undecaprenyl pyrophosphate synthase
MSSKRIRRLLKAVEKLKPVDYPDRFKKDGNDIYALSNNEWTKLEPKEVIRLKNAYKKMDQEIMKRNTDEIIDIDVQIIDDDTEIEEPLIDFEDGYQLFEDGFQHVITVEPQEKS